jgi:lantibiotic modifying enzyme
VRLYWNLTSDGAVSLMRLVTRVLNDAHLPFRLKVVDHPTRYVRCDAVVLYIPRGEYFATMAALEPVYAALGSSLRSQVPVFTKELAPGLGLAESPDNGESFGLSRCALLAEGLIRAYAQDKRPIEERLHAVLQCFTEAEIDPHKPYLNASSMDQYHFSLRTPGSHVEDAAPSSPQARLYGPEAYLETAHSIARRLVAEAVWEGKKCNWIGARLTTDIGRSVRHSPVLEHAALGSDLYSGTAGVALFLAEEQALSGDLQVKEAAVGAIRQALDYTILIPEHLRFGLYTGWMGVALTAARVGVLTQEACLLDQAQALSLLCAESLARNGTHEHDLMGGSAGAIIASLSLRELLGDADSHLLDFAISLGERILQAAHSSSYGDGYYWESARKRFPRPLTGLSHGASGIGYALLELAAATRDERYLNAAHAAFRYERHWLDLVAGNWPDFRENRSGKKHGVYTPTFATQWCHGAPGIALSRLRACATLGDPTARDEAILALKTTARWVEGALTTDDTNYSLCHGLAGNADVLMQGSLTLPLDPDTAMGSNLTHDVARFGIEKYAATGDWPCGAGGGVAPGLMLGLAGIGYFYLRLYKPSIPAVLLVQHEEWKQMA